MFGWLRRTVESFGSPRSGQWPGGSAPTITATNGKVDIIRFVSDGSYWYGSINQNY